ncbi:MAG: hypothetical protein EZS28_042898, partial [Streblomastix strix]
MCFRRII